MQGDDPKDRSLGPLTKRLRGKPISDDLDKSVGALLQRYDHVIDAVAAYPGREDAGPKEVVTVDMTSKYLGVCATKKHGELKLTQTVNPSNWIFDKATGQYKASKFPNVEKVGEKLGPLTVFAANLSQDFGVAGGNLSVFFDILRTLWPSHKPRTIELTATTCGKRVDKSQPNLSLNTLLRIYRKDSYQIGIKVPAFGKFTKSGSGTVNGDAKSTSESSRSTMFGRNRTSTSSERSSDGYSHSQETWKGNEGARYSQSASNDALPGRTNRESVAWKSSGGGIKYTETKGNFSGKRYASATELYGDLKKAPGFALVLKRNDRELSFSPDPNAPKSGAKTIADRVIGGLEKAGKAIQDAIDVFNSAPQFGWKFEIEIAFLEGSAAFQWEPKLLPKTSSGRYYPVRHQGTFKLALDVFALTAKLSFGIEARAVGTALVLKVEISGSLKFGLEYEGEFKLPPSTRTTFEIGIKPEGKLKGSAIIHVKVAGYTLIDGRLDCEVTFNVRNGKFRIDPQKGPVIEGTLRREAVYLKGYVNTPFGRRAMEPKKLCNESDILSFGG
jgi:hypothetical protein